VQTPFELRLETLKSRIDGACVRAGRNASEVKLVAVSKTHPPAALRDAISAGVNVFGENKVQEAETKVHEIGRAAAEWHLIGHLQSNKARKAVQLFDVIHSIDSVELAQRLERICIEERRDSLSVFAQVDLGGEETKSGISEAELPQLIGYLRTCERLRFDGLMILPPFLDDAELMRPYFRRIRAIRDEVIPGGELSMGMSGDYEAAIEEGATLIRVGTALFGEREYTR
jgi:pyridoxal phosphate enzyme (YggS family)